MFHTVKGDTMKRLIIICSVLALFSAPVCAAEKNTETAPRVPTTETGETQVRIITAIHLHEFVFGRDAYQISDLIQYYSDTGQRVTKAYFQADDGVMFKLDADNKIYYMQKMPY